MKNSLLSILLLLTGFFASAQKVVEPPATNPEWNKPYPPFQIAGNLYYVGTYELACYLVVTPQGNILINTGLAASAPLIKNSIESLGFKLGDIKILLNTQAHHDHMGAMAEIQKMTGAEMMVNQGDSAVTADGGKSDYAFGGANSLFAPVHINKVLHDGDSINLGGMHLVMLNHPGHTKGSCSFLFNVKDEKRSYKVLIANIPTIVTDKPFSGIPDYPNISQDYAYTLQAMKNLSFDIWLASHASQFRLHSRHKPGSAYNPSAFMDRKGYDAVLKACQKDYAKKTKGKKR